MSPAQRVSGDTATIGKFRANERNKLIFLSESVYR